MEQLDLSGLACPMPVIKIKKYLFENSDHDINVVVTVSDRGALKDIPAFCKQQGLQCQLIDDDERIVFQLSRLDSTHHE